MAILVNGFLGSGLLRGRVGDKIYSVKNGKNYVRQVSMRTAPPTEAMIAHQQRFALAAGICRTLRNEMKKYITFSNPVEMQGKMASAMMGWLKRHHTSPAEKGDHTEAFGKCMLSKSSFLTERWKNRITFSHATDGIVSITIPEFIPGELLPVTAQASYVLCVIVVAGVAVDTGELTESWLKEISFKHNHTVVPAQTIDLPLEAAAGSLIVTAMSLEFHTGSTGMSLDARYRPAGIVNVEYK